MSETAIIRIKQLLATSEPAELGPGPRQDVKSESELNDQLDLLLGELKLSSVRQQLVRSVILLWHDHLDASHNISQGIENADGSFVHAIMHRREPDAWNSKYWWRRVGQHPAFPEIAKRVGDRLADSHGREEAGLTRRLIPGGRWDASAFVDACDAAKDQPVIKLLREIQRIESEVLLEFFCHE